MALNLIFNQKKCPKVKADIVNMPEELEKEVD